MSRCMAFKLTFKKKSAIVNDARRVSKLGRRLHFISIKKQKEKLKSLEVVKPREEGKIKLKLEFNRLGNRSGMHNRENPPSSEHMSKIRAMRKIYNKQMPVLQCSGCAYSQQCPQFKAGYECAYLPFLNSHDIKNEDDLLDEMKNMATVSVRRAHLQTIMETLTGTAPSLEVSESHAMAFSQLKMLSETMTEMGKTSLEIEAEGGSVISKIFGDLGSLIEDTAQQRLNPILVEPPLTIDIAHGEASNEDVVQELVHAHTRDELAHVGKVQRDSRQMPVVAMGELKK